MLRAIKEIIILLLICLVALLLLAVVFYEYIPARKNVTEISSYSDTSKISELLADDIDEKSKDVLLTYEEGEYEVTSSDLKNYQATEKYVPGKANPFAPAEKRTTKSDPNSISTDTNTTKSDDSSNTTSTYIKDKGTK